VDACQLHRAEWRKGSCSGQRVGECAEVAAWRTSSYSGQNGSCVEIGNDRARAVAVRDSKDPEGPKLVIGPQDWQRFAARVKAGHFGPA
jgi:hypothetical protein